MKRTGGLTPSLGSVGDLAVPAGDADPPSLVVRELADLAGRVRSPGRGRRERALRGRTGDPNGAAGGPSAGYGEGVPR